MPREIGSFTRVDFFSLDLLKVFGKSKTYSPKRWFSGWCIGSEWKIFVNLIVLMMSCYLMCSAHSLQIEGFAGASCPALVFLPCLRLLISFLVFCGEKRAAQGEHCCTDTVQPCFGSERDLPNMAIEDLSSDLSEASFSLHAVSDWANSFCMMVLPLGLELLVLVVVMKNKDASIKMLQVDFLSLIGAM